MANKKMWLRNWDNLFTALFGFNTMSETSTSAPTHDTVWFRAMNSGTYIRPVVGSAWSHGILASALGMRMNGGWLYNPTSIRTSTTNYPQRAYDYLPVGITLGSGTVDPAYDDYKCYTPLGSMSIGAVRLIANGTYNSEDKTYTKTVVIPITYTGSTPVNVQEFGINVFIPIGEDSTYQGLNAQAIMVYHEVFEEPVTLLQNDTIEITFSQIVAQPNYVPYPAEAEDEATE